MAKKIKITGIIIAVIWVGSLVAAQIILPEKNPMPKNPLPDWISANSQDILRRSCFDCHSNEVIYSWYSYMPAVAILVARDVRVGRKKVNFSLWTNEYSKRIDKGFERSLDAIKEGEMPFKPYLITHSDAKVTRDDYLSLERDYKAWKAAIGKSASSGAGDNNDDDDHDHDDHDHDDHDHDDHDDDDYDDDHDDN